MSALNISEILMCDPKEKLVLSEFVFSTIASASLYDTPMRIEPKSLEGILKRNRKGKFQIKKLEYTQLKNQA